LFSPRFPRQSQGVVLRDTDPNPSRLRLRGYHPLCRAVPGHFGFAREGAVGPFNSTSLNGFPFRFGLGFSPFARRYSGNPILVSFPPPTWMFPFGGFPLPKWKRREFIAAGSPIRGSPDLRLHAPTRGLSQLATPFFGARAEPSIRRRSALSLLGNPCSIGV